MKHRMAPKTQTAFRLEEELIERLDRYADRLNREQPGLDVTRAAVVRLLLMKALDEVESDRRKKRGKP